MMMCQLCGKREATKRYQVNIMGMNKDVFLCNECVKGFLDNAGLPENEKKELGFGAYSTEADQGSPITSGGKRSDEIHTRRKLNQLHFRLTDAVRDERYEDAAELRDKINEIEGEVYINGK